MKQISFYGASGAEYVFKQVDLGVTLISQNAVAIFTAADSYGLRVIRVVDAHRTGEGMLQAFLEARHYGANTLFVLTGEAAGDATSIVADLEAGLSPVMLSRSPIFAAAA